MDALGSYGRVPTGSYERNGFWTRRRKTATSMLTVLGLIAGIAIAFKLFDRTVPNNVVRDASTFNYEIEKRDALLNESAFVAASGTNPIFNTSPTGPDMYPGDIRSVDVRLRNTNTAPAKDASFEVFIQDIVVRDRSTGTPVTILTTDPRWGRFVSFWTFSVDKQLVLSSAAGDVTTSQPVDRYSQACTGGLREITKNSPCSLGQIRAAGSKSLLNEPTDQRLYRFKLAEADDGTDQSAFKGWEVQLSLVFQARLPAVVEPVIVGDR